MKKRNFSAIANIVERLGEDGTFWRIA